MQREVRIDVLRGVAILTIILDHVTWLCSKAGMTGVRVQTLTLNGFSSSAETFVFLSGYMVGLVYLPRSQARLMMVRRAVTLYGVNLALFVAIVIIGAFSSQEVRSIAHLNDVLAPPRTGLLSFLLFGGGPAFSDILSLYVILLVFAVGVARLVRDNAAWALGLSAALYLASYLPFASLPRALVARDLPFNPLAWQLLFTIGMVGGFRRWHAMVFDRLARRPGVTVAAGLALVVFGVFSRLNDAGIIHARGNDLVNLRPVALLDAMTVMVFFCGVLSLAGPLPSTAVGRMLQLLGRNSLLCFCTSIVITYLAFDLWLMAGRPYALYLVLECLVVAATLGMAQLFDGKRFRWSHPRARPVGVTS